jgi:hypothetical protein
MDSKQWSGMFKATLCFGFRFYIDWLESDYYASSEDLTLLKTSKCFMMEVWGTR